MAKAQEKKIVRGMTLVRAGSGMARFKIVADMNKDRSADKAIVSKREMVLNRNILPDDYEPEKYDVSAELVVTVRVRKK